MGRWRAQRPAQLGQLPPLHGAQVDVGDTFQELAGRKRDNLSRKVFRRFLGVASLSRIQITVIVGGDFCL